MAQITAALVKQLREMTDSPMMECKKALVEADGDIEKAVDVLRTMGIAKAVKRTNRRIVCLSLYLDMIAVSIWHYLIIGVVTYNLLIDASTRLAKHAKFPN